MNGLLRWILWVLLAPGLAGCGPLTQDAQQGADMRVETAIAATVSALQTFEATLKDTPAPLPSPTQIIEEQETATPTSTPLPVLPEGEPYQIGVSVGGRPLEVYRFGSGEHVRMIAAGIHGGYEWNTVALAYELIAHIQANPAAVPSDTTLYILPAINVDGYERVHGVDGRANDNNIDLNRNWLANWKPDWNHSGCWQMAPIEAGPHPHSEPEVQAVASFILSYTPEALISYHSAALGIFAGGQPTDTASLDLAQTLAEVSTYPFPPFGSSCEVTGMFVNWAVGLGIAAVDVELTNHHDTDFAMNLKVMEAFLKWR